MFNPFLSIASFRQATTSFPAWNEQLLTLDNKCDSFNVKEVHLEYM